MPCIATNAETIVLLVARLAILRIAVQSQREVAKDQRPEAVEKKEAWRVLPIVLDINHVVDDWVSFIILINIIIVNDYNYNSKTNI